MVNRTMASATGPFVIQFFVPLMTYLSLYASAVTGSGPGAGEAVALRFRTAVVRCSAASLPACGSVSPKQPSFSPWA